MLKDIVAVESRGGHTLRLRFEDGIEGDVDVAELVRFSGVFAPLEDPREFAKVRIDAETGTVCWPNGADLDPVVLYARITGGSLSSLGSTSTPAHDVR